MQLLHATQAGIVKRQKEERPEILSLHYALEKRCMKTEEKQGRVKVEEDKEEEGSKDQEEPKAPTLNA